MSNIKKIIGIVLAVVMAFSVASVAFAAEGDAYTVSFVAGATTLEPGQSTTIEVKVTANYPVTTISIPVFFDKTKLDVTAVESTGMTVKSIVEETNTNDVEKFYVGTSYDKATTGVRALVAFAKQGDTLTTYNNTTVMTLTVTAKADASGTADVFCDAVTVKTSSNTTGTLYVGKNSSGTNTLDSDSEWIDDATITAAATSITIASAAGDPELQLTTAGTTAGVVIDPNRCNTVATGGYDGAIYGFEPNTKTNVINAAYFTVTNEGTYDITCYSGSRVGTGSTLVVKDKNGTTVATYVIIIFGDIDGNGRINATDITNFENVFYANNIPTEYTAKKIAMNVDNNTRVNAVDISTLSGNFYGSSLSQAGIAAGLIVKTTAGTGYNAP